MAGVILEVREIYICETAFEYFLILGQGFVLLFFWFMAICKYEINTTAVFFVLVYDRFVNFCQN